MDLPFNGRACVRRWTRWIWQAVLAIAFHISLSQYIADEASPHLPLLLDSSDDSEFSSFGGFLHDMTLESDAQSRTLYFAHPPQSSTKSAKLILQLQESSGASRLYPAYDVLPSSILSPLLLRILSSLRRRSVGSTRNDLLVTISDEYNTLETSPENSSQAIGERDIWARTVGLISPDTNEDLADSYSFSVQFRLRTGSVWKGRILANGNYELMTLYNDRPNTIARWTLRKRNLRLDGGRDYKTRFGFSIINPLARRHPIIANVDHKSVSVLNTGTTYVDELRNTGEQLFAIILLSSVWVALCEGWSNFGTANIAVDSQFVPEHASSYCQIDDMAVSFRKRPMSKSAMRKWRASISLSSTSLNRVTKPNITAGDFTNRLNPRSNSGSSNYCHSILTVRGSATRPALADVQSNRSSLLVLSGHVQCNTLSATEESDRATFYNADTHIVVLPPLRAESEPGDVTDAKRKHLKRWFGQTVKVMKRVLKNHLRLCS